MTKVRIMTWRKSVEPELIKAHLRLKGVLLKDLAKNHNVDKSYLSHILRGSVDESRTVLAIKREICEVLELSAGEVFPDSELAKPLASVG